MHSHVCELTAMIAKGDFFTQHHIAPRYRRERELKGHIMNMVTHIIFISVLILPGIIYIFDP